MSLCCVNALTVSISTPAVSIFPFPADFCFFVCPQMANEAKPCPCDIGDRMEYGGLGQEIKLEHTKAYVVKPSTASDKAIIVIQDIYGWQLPNTRYMADMLAANGYMYVKKKEMRTRP